MTDSTTRAAPASAGAPGAQGVLDKPAAPESQAVRKIPDAHRSAARALDLHHGQAPPAALHDHVFIQNLDDQTRIVADADTFSSILFQSRGGEDPQLLTIKPRVGDGLGVEGP